MSEVRLYVALYADADVQAQVVREVRKRGHDVAYAHELDHSQWSDEQHLVYAAANDRALFTHNIKHFEPLYQAWWDTDRKHAGIIVSAHMETGELVRRLLKLLDTVTADEMVNNYKNLGEFT